MQNVYTLTPIFVRQESPEKAVFVREDSLEMANAPLILKAIPLLAETQCIVAALV